MDLTPYDEFKTFKKAWDLNSLENKKKGLRMIEEQFTTDTLINSVGLFLRLGSLTLMTLTTLDYCNITDIGMLESLVDIKTVNMQFLGEQYAVPFRDYSVISSNLMYGLIYTYGCAMSVISYNKPEWYKSIRDFFIRLEKS
ncbi:hypothetical protein COV11_02945 [Candidatus Woesearchaeota archaeon CG10_big_fil_rev_8_21_14_0_10_30_7]|nr:MAG: hypothetical protein COV11_02945 [Candidatus Woesearchaeota archaeon CG10_big_fil_rev_8_21_14_0_10_30_7]